MESLPTINFFVDQFIEIIFQQFYSILTFMFKGYNVKLVFKNRPGFSLHSINTKGFDKKTGEEIPTMETLKPNILHYENMSCIKYNYKQKQGDKSDLEFWGCATGFENKTKKERKSRSQQKHHKYSQSEHIFQQYLRRRPSLILTRRKQYQFQQKINSNHRTQDVEIPRVSLEGSKYKAPSTPKSQKKHNRKTSTSSRGSIEDLCLEFGLSRKVITPCENQLCEQQQQYMNEHYYRVRCLNERRIKKVQ